MGCLFYVALTFIVSFWAFTYYETHKEKIKLFLNFFLNFKTQRNGK